MKVLIILVNQVQYRLPLSAMYNPGVYKKPLDSFQVFGAVQHVTYQVNGPICRLVKLPVEVAIVGAK